MIAYLELSYFLLEIIMLCQCLLQTRNTLKYACLLQITQGKVRTEHPVVDWLHYNVNILKSENTAYFVKECLHYHVNTHQCGNAVHFRAIRTCAVAKK